MLIDNYANVDFKPWLDGNVRSAYLQEKKPTANVFFISKLWSMWNARNKFEFDNNLINLEVVLRESNNFAWCILHAFKQRSNLPNNNQNMLINWKFPFTCTIKMNTDGSCLQNPCPAGFGCVARYGQGNWLEGFAGFIGKATILKAELWAVRETMMLIKKKDCVYVIVED